MSETINEVAPMAKTRQGTPYHSIGVAILHDRKPILNERLNKLGMKTLGDLATFFITGDGVVEALLPLMEPYRASKVKVTKAQRQEAVDSLRGLSPEKLQRLMELAASSIRR